MELKQLPGFYLLLVTVIELSLCVGCSDSANDKLETDSALVTKCSEPIDAGAIVDEALQEQTVFRQDEVLEYRITINDEVLADLDEHGIDEEYRPASLRVTGRCIDETFDQIGYRYKGAATLARCWNRETGARIYDFPCGKISGKLKFNKYNEDERFFGLKRLNLHAMVDDVTKMHEKLSYRIFNDFGVVAPRTAYARLYVNGELKGLFLAVEAIDGRFTKFRFPAGGDGNLYKEIWPSIGVTEATIHRHLKTNNDPDDTTDVSDFIHFQDAITSTTADSFVSTASRVLNVDAMLRYLAVDRCIRNWDGITAFYNPNSPHNFYWYHDAGNSNKFYLIPWDVDRTFTTFDLYADPPPSCPHAPVPNWNESPQNCDPRTTCNNDIPITPCRCDHFLNMLALTQWREFEALGHHLLETVVADQRLGALIKVWMSQAADAVSEDPYINRIHWEKQVEQFRSAVRETLVDFESLLEDGLVDESQ